METETPGKEFSPRAVREQLGQNGPEETYGHLSEIGTHPRLARMQSAGGILVSDEGEKRGVLRIRSVLAGAPADDHRLLPPS
jgi:hypothetical protein